MVTEKNNKLYLAKIFLNHGYHIITSEIDNIILFIKTIDTAIEDLKKDNTKHVKEKYITYYQDIFPQISYSASIVILFAVFEKLLKEFCEKIQIVQNIKIELKDFSGNGDLEKCKIYFNKVLNINIIEICPDWSKIIEIQKLRNAIIHKDSSIIKDETKPIEKQELYTIIDKNPNLVLIDDEFIFIKNSEILYEYCKIINDYLLKINEKVLEMNYHISKKPV
jgi:hypothetical protein